jgi:hypothetical protein
VKDFEDLFEEKAGLAKTRVGMMRNLADDYEYATLQEVRKLRKRT